MSKKMLFLTGATGLVGRHLLQNFLDHSDIEISILIRGKNAIDSKQRVENVLKDFYSKEKIKKILNKRLNIIEGDVSLSNMGIRNKSQLKKLYNSICEIFHSAALAEFKQPLARVRHVNVQGTKNICNFALKCKNLNKLNYVSTAFISGNFRGRFSEKDYDKSQEFNNTYEQSKFEAEREIHKFIKKGLKVAVYRPSIIVGQYKTGKTNNFRMFYQPFRTLSLNILERIPITINTKLNLIACDTVAKAIYILSKNYNNSDVYHIVSPRSIPIMDLMKFASKFFGYKEPDYTALKKFNLSSLNPVQKSLINPYIPYFNFCASFDSQYTQKKLRKVKYRFPHINKNFIIRQFKFCEKAGYIKKQND
jgi:thioester reductase-like protein